MRVIIDRFEGDFAVVELMNGELFENLPRTLVPSGAKEGDVLKISIDCETTSQRREHISEMLGKLFDNGGRESDQ